jgi:hypothetical protein
MSKKKITHYSLRNRTLGYEIYQSQVKESIKISEIEDYDTE